MANAQEAADKVIDLINELTTNMTLDEYDEFLDIVGSEVDCRIDCRNDEKIDGNV